MIGGINDNSFQLKIKSLGQGMRPAQESIHLQAKTMPTDSAARQPMPKSAQPIGPEQAATTPIVDRV
jgi:hypothetical protein